jgi:hypothetical protein
MRLLLTCAVLLGLAAAGCSGTSHPAGPARPVGAASSPTPTPSTSGAPSDGGDLNAKLLALSDLPPGFTGGKPSSPRDVKFPPGCEFLSTPPHDGPVAEMNFAALGAPEKMRLVDEIIGRSTEAKAQAVLTRARSAQTTCSSYDAGGGRVRLSAVAMPRVGDDSVAFRLAAAGDSSAMSGDIVLIRSGALSAYLVDLSQRPDTALIQRLARTAAAKLTR